MPHAIAITEDDTETSLSALDRIQRLSKPFSLLFSVLLAGMTFVTVLTVGSALIYDGPHVRVSSDLLEAGQGQLMILAADTHALWPETMPLADLPLKHRIVFAIGVFLQWGSLAVVFFHTRALFRLYERGDVFAPGTVDCIRQIALWMVLWGIAPTIVHQISALNGIVDVGWFRASSVAGIILGGFLYLLAKIIDLGRDIARDRAQYI